MYEVIPNPNLTSKYSYNVTYKLFNCICYHIEKGLIEMLDILNDQDRPTFSTLERVDFSKPFREAYFKLAEILAKSQKERVCLSMLFSKIINPSLEDSFNIVVCRSTWWRRNHNCGGSEEIEFISREITSLIKKVAIACTYNTGNCVHEFDIAAAGGQILEGYISEMSDRPSCVEDFWNAQLCYYVIFGALRENCL